MPACSFSLRKVPRFSSISPLRPSTIPGSLSHRPFADKPQLFAAELPTSLRKMGLGIPSFRMWAFHPPAPPTHTPHTTSSELQPDLSPLFPSGRTYRLAAVDVYLEGLLLQGLQSDLHGGG